MGYMRHHAIIVTGWDPHRLRALHGHAAANFPAVSPILPSGINGYASFFIPPDGSKEGWPESDEGDDRRAAFKRHLRSLEVDGGSYFDWAEVQYGDDDGDDRVVETDRLRADEAADRL